MESSYVCMYVCMYVHVYIRGYMYACVIICACVLLFLPSPPPSPSPSTVISMCTKHFAKKKQKKNEQIHGFMKLFPEDISDYLYTTLGVS